MLARAIAFALLTVLAACSIVPAATVSSENPLIFDANEFDQAEKIAIFIPGALTSVGIFENTEDWANEGYARAYYRYPGLDGLPLDHRITPAAAAAQVAAFAAQYPDKPVALVGYSTGGLVALLAAPQIDSPVHVAAMSTAVEYGGGFPTILRGGRDIVRAAVATGSLRRADIWKRFWAGLLYGPDALGDPSYAAVLKRDEALGEKIRVDLDPAIALSHTLALLNWEVPEDLDLTGIPLAFFVGLNDPVFSTAQTQTFARQVGNVTIYGYPRQGHLLFFTNPDVFRDILNFAENRPVVR